MDFVENWQKKCPQLLFWLLLVIFRSLKRGITKTLGTFSRFEAERGRALLSEWGWERGGVKKCACLASLESARFGAWVLKRETTSPS